MSNIKYYVPGQLESSKFASRKEPYYKSLNKIKSLGYTIDDYIHYFPCFAGKLTLARYLSIFECYQKTLGIAGHMAEVGIYKGACTLLMAKLSELYEPNALTQVHGFDWFQGAINLADEDKENIVEGAYAESGERVNALIEAQDLQHIVKLHEIDMASDEIKTFFQRNIHMQFKLVLFDAGLYEVVKNALPYFWERLTPGGIIVFDQYNFDIAPGETRAIREILPNSVIRSFPNGWMPTAYVVKE